MEEFFWQRDCFDLADFEFVEKCAPSSGRIFVKTRFRFLSHLGTFAMLIGIISWGGLLHAQQTAPDTQQSQPQTQLPPDQTDPPSQTQPGAKQVPPDTEAQSPDQTSVQIFTGTVMKQGNKYMFQDAGGVIYDIDHQAEVSKFEGKRVRIHGTLDPTTKMIHVQ